MRRILGALFCILVVLRTAHSQQLLTSPLPDLSKFATTMQLSDAANANLLALQQANQNAGYITLPQAVAAAPVQSVNGKTGAIVTATLPGTYTVQPGGASPLPSPTLNPGRYANATDVGGAGVNGGPGAAQIYDTGTCWKRMNPAVAPIVVTAAATVSMVALQQSSIVQLAAAAGGLLAAVSINVTGACAGDVFTVNVPSGVISTVGTLGVSTNGSPALSVSGVTGGAWYDFVYTGSNVVKIRGGTL